MREKIWFKDVGVLCMHLLKCQCKFMVQRGKDMDLAHFW